MQKLSLNTLQRLSVIGALNGHKITNVTDFNKASRILEKVELNPDEKEKLNFKMKDDGAITWGQDDSGTPIEGFSDIIIDVELDDEKLKFLKEVIEDKIKLGSTLSSVIDRAVIEVHSQLSDPKRSE